MMLNYILLSLLLLFNLTFSQRALVEKLIDYPVQLPLIIDHGGGGENVGLPEHTIPAYEFAMHAEADYIAPDIVMTKDFVLVCHHGLTLASTTDVRDRWGLKYLRTAEKNITNDNRILTIRDDWLISDLTHAQLKTLKVKRNKADNDNRPTYFDGLFTIPTFDEFMEAMQRFTLKSISLRNTKTKVIGIIPELMHSSYFNALAGIPFFVEGLFIKKLEEFGYSFATTKTVKKGKIPWCTYHATTIPCNPVIVQSREVATIEYLSNITSLRLLTVLDKNNIEYLTYEGFQKLVGKTEFVNPFIDFFYMITPKTEEEYEQFGYNKSEMEQLGGLIPSEEIAVYAEERDLRISINLISNPVENTNLTIKKKLELEQFLKLGVKAVFVERIGESLRRRDDYIRKVTEEEKDSRTSILIIVLLLALLFQNRHLLQ